MAGITGIRVLISSNPEYEPEYREAAKRGKGTTAQRRRYYNKRASESFFFGDELASKKEKSRGMPRFS
jgi:hypothetical protein